jgi:hypothetical protein
MWECCIFSDVLQRNVDHFEIRRKVTSRIFLILGIPVV